VTKPKWKLKNKKKKKFKGDNLKIFKVELLITQGFNISRTLAEGTKQKLKINSNGRQPQNI
jgi:hypothetical protein